MADDLVKPVDEYRDKDLFEARSYNASRLRLTRGKDTYEFEKVAGSGENAADKWQRLNAGGARADVETAPMDDLLSKLFGLRAASFQTSTQGAGLDQPALVVAVSFDGDKYERVRFAKPGTEVFAGRDGDPGAAKIDADNYDQVIKALDAVLSPPKPTT
jgi:hypothetical protein